MFTLDKNELEKLNKDILENTKKYELVLTKNTGAYDIEKGMKLIHGQKDLEYRR
jgi:hypothetical protein